MPKLYIIFVVLYFSFLIATLLKDLIWGIYLSLIIYFTSPWTKWWGAFLPEIRWVFILGIVNIAAFLMRSKKYAHARVLDSKELKLLILFSIIMLLVGFVSVWPEQHWQVFDKHVKVVIFLLLMYKATDTRAKFEGLLWVYITGVFYVAWVAYETGRSGGGRLEGVGTIDSTDANDIGAIFVTAIPLLLFYIMEAKKVYLRVLAFLFLPFVLNGLILVNSRGAVVGVAVSMCIFVGAILFSKSRSLGFKVRVIIGAIACFVLFLYLADPAFWNRQSTITADKEASPDKDYNRLTIWMYALKLAIDRPWGVGGMGYTLLSPTFLPPEVMGDSPLKAIHSTYLEALTAFGVLGFLVFLLFIRAGYKDVQRTQLTLRASNDTYLRMQGHALLAAYTGFLVAAVFINRLYCEVTYYFPIFFAIFKNLYDKRHVVDNPVPLPASTGNFAMRRINRRER